MIELNGISKAVASKIILNNINMSFPKNGFICLVGSNGSGKSTLLNIIGGIDRPTSGSVNFNGVNINEMNEKDKALFYENHVSFIFQNLNLFENESVIDNINIVSDLSANDDLIKYLGLISILNKKVKNLSGGEQQKVAIARALSKDSEILLADEPTSSLDYDMKVKVFEYLKQISRKRLVIMVSHDLELVQKYCNYVVVMNEGNIIRTTKCCPIEFNELTNFKEFHNNFKMFKFLKYNFFSNKKKLIFSNILLSFTFVMILISLALASINFVKLHADTMNAENDGLMIFEKIQSSNDGDLIVANDFSDSDIEYLSKEKVSNSELIIGKTINVTGKPINFSINVKKDSNLYYQHLLINKLSFVNINSIKYEITGKVPENNNEIVISSYLADYIIKYGVLKTDGDVFRPENYNDIINNNQLLALGSIGVKIAGIYDINKDKFNLLNTNDKLPSNYNNLNELLDEYITNLAGNIYVTDNFFELFSNLTPTVNDNYIFKLQEDSNKYLQSSPLVFNTSNPVKLVNGEMISDLKDDEIIINDDILNNLKFNYDDCIGKEINIYAVNSFNLYQADNYRLKIVGVSTDGDYYINHSMLRNVIDSKIYVNKIFLNENKSNITLKILDKFNIENNKNYIVKTNYSQSIANIQNVCKTIKILFEIITPILLIFTLIVIVNYAFNSFDYHKKDIAILKSFGIKNNLIGLLFVLELGIIALVSFTISIIFFEAIKIILNAVISNILSFNVPAISFNFISIIIILFIISIIVLVTIFIFKKISKNFDFESLAKIN